MSITDLDSLFQPDAGVRSAGFGDLGETSGARINLPGGSTGDLPPEIERLVYAVDALRAGDRPIVIQFTGVAGAEGTSLVASSFTRAAAAMHARPVLFIDCRPARREPGLVEARRQGRPLASAVMTVLGQHEVAVARLAASAVSVAGRGAAEVEAILDEARGIYPMIVLDTPGALPASSALSRFCDGTILVIEYARTRSDAARAAKAEIERFGGQVIGCVLNRHREAMPPWVSRLLG